MISYSPLQKTLLEKQITLDKLAADINYSGLRRKLNSGTYLSLKTIDMICSYLNCEIADVVEFKPGEMKKVDYTVGYTVDWPKVFDLLQIKNMTFKDASIKLGHSQSYLHNLSISKRTSNKVVRQLCLLLECEPEKIAIEIKK